MTSEPHAPASDVSDFYDRITDLYTQVWGANIHVGYWDEGDELSSIDDATERLTAELLQRLAPSGGQHILDVGCGVGQPAISLARAETSVRVTGISLSRFQIDRALARAEDAGVADRTHFEVADAVSLPFPDGSFDGAWAIESLLHIGDKTKALAEIKRVLRPGSRFIVADMFHQPRADIDVEGLVTTVGLDDYQGLIERSGMIPLDITDVTARTRIPEQIKQPLRDGLLDRTDELIEILGRETYEHVSKSDDMFDNPGFGYVLATARRD